jgi:hypothetical protein
LRGQGGEYFIFVRSVPILVGLGVASVTNVQRLFCELVPTNFNFFMPVIEGFVLFILLRDMTFGLGRSFFIFDAFFMLVRVINLSLARVFE